jgi:hypothetical protein
MKVKRVGLALLVLVALVVAAAIALLAWANSDFTECYALFRAESDAEAVADELDKAAPDVGLDLDNERRGGRPATTFRTGASGVDARPLTRAFAPAVRAHGGVLGHPGAGCRERGPFMSTDACLRLAPTRQSPVRSPRDGGRRGAHPPDALASTRPSVSAARSHVWENSLSCSESARLNRRTPTVKATTNANASSTATTIDPRNQEQQ